jgi:catechol 2,3-dioxygenase-like lactoylglutathione lyase family enzyme
MDKARPRTQPRLRSALVPRLSFALACCLGTAATQAGAQQVARPAITGIAAVQIYVTDTEKARVFYQQRLGLAPKGGSCAKAIFVCLVVNNHQEIQLVEAPNPVPANLIAKVAFTTPDVTQMRSYLQSKGFDANPISTSPEGVRHFSLLDPEGHVVSFIQLPSSSAKDKTANQISARIIHAGFIVKDRRAEDHFYQDVLGFHLYWQGGMKDSETSWVSMQVPDGTDWLEYMLNISPDASHHVIGIMNHIALGVPAIQAAKDQFVKNGGTLSEEPKLGRDGKWQLNLYDPDDTRVECMEFKPAEKPCCSEFTGTHPAP